MVTRGNEYFNNGNAVVSFTIQTVVRRVTMKAPSHRNPGTRFAVPGWEAPNTVAGALLDAVADMVSSSLSSGSIQGLDSPNQIDTGNEPVRFGWSWLFISEPVKPAGTGVVTGTAEGPPGFSSLPVPNGWRTETGTVRRPTFLRQRTVRRRR